MAQWQYNLNQNGWKYAENASKFIRFKYRKYKTDTKIICMRDETLKGMGMKVEKKNKFIFFCLLLVFAIGIFFVTRIADVMTETVTVNAVVTKTYKVKKKRGKNIPV